MRTTAATCFLVEATDAGVRVQAGASGTAATARSRSITAPTADVATTASAPATEEALVGVAFAGVSARAARSRTTEPLP